MTTKNKDEIARTSYWLPMNFSWSKVPWWVLILIITGILISILIMTNSNYRETFIFLRAGVILTLRLTLTAFPIAMVIGLVTGLARLSKNPIME